MLIFHFSDSWRSEFPHFVIAIILKYVSFLHPTHPTTIAAGMKAILIPTSI
jgi:hypothetical protein